MLTVLFRMRQLSRLLLHKIRKPSQQKKINHFTIQMTFAFLKENLEKDNVLARPIPNGHTTLNPCQFDMDITSIRRRSNFHEFPRHFRVLFRCNFDGRKIHVVSTYFFQCNFDSRKIHVVSTYFYRCNFAGQKCTLFPRNFFDAISMAEKFMLFPRTFFDVISMVEKPTLFPRTFISVISLVEKSTLFLLVFFDVILMDKSSTWFLVSCKLMKTFKVFLCL